MSMRTAEAVAMQAVIEMQRPKDISRSPWMLTGLLLIATLLLLVAKPWLAGMYGPSAPFSLQASERHGNLVLLWDPRHPAVKRAEAATVTIEESGKVVVHRLASETLRTGSFTYTQTSNDVVATLTLLRDEQPIASSLVRSVGP